jgi:hypothetical protein
MEMSLRWSPISLVPNPWPYWETISSAWAPIKTLSLLIGKKTRIIDLEQKTVIPGLIDAHIHPFGAGRALTVLDLKGLSKEQILEN